MPVQDMTIPDLNTLVGNSLDNNVLIYEEKLYEILNATINSEILTENSTLRAKAKLIIFCMLHSN